MVQRFYCCSIFHCHGRVFSSKPYCIMSVKQTLACNSEVLYSSVRKRYNGYTISNANVTFYCKSFPLLCFNNSGTNCLTYSHYLLQFGLKTISMQYYVIFFNRKQAATIFICQFSINFQGNGGHFK